MPSVSDLPKIEAQSKTSPEQAVVSYTTLLKGIPEDASDDQSIRLKETATLKLGELYKQLNRSQDLANLVRNSHSMLGSLPKAKVAKIVRMLLDCFPLNTSELQINVTKELIAWAKEEKRVFLRQNLETRLVGLLIPTSPSDALTLIATLTRELKRLDDKAQLLEVQLLESKVWLNLRNLAKSRAALTSARTSANSIYCPPLTQAALDMQSGILHAEEKDYKTAYSYFFETLEGYSSLDDDRAVVGLKYMCLSKIMMGEPESVAALLTGKLGLRYASKDLEAMKAVAGAYTSRSLSDFEKAMASYKDQLGGDALVRNHLSNLYEQLLEANLIKVIEPFSRVEVSHVASLVGLPEAVVERKLGVMVLDKVLNGILDQGSGHLILFEEAQKDETIEAALETIKSLGSVVEGLETKARTV